MKKVKAIYIIGIIALLSAIMVIPAAAVFEPYECDVYVHEGESIQAAIDGASPGNTICIYNGTYSVGELSTKKPYLKIIGEGANKVILDCDGAMGILMPSTSSGDNATGTVLEGFKVVSSVYGVVVGNSGFPASDCLIRNCIFDGSTGDYGVWILAPNTIFINNIVSNATGCFALTLEDESCTIVNNTIINGRGDPGPAIFLWGSRENCANNTIKKNNITLCKAGFGACDAGEGNKIYLNNFGDNDVTAMALGGIPNPIYWNSTEQIEYVYDSTEYMNYPGNYWSTDYGGTDADGDGIGDISYEVPDGLGEDYRPLMAGFENYFGPPAACGCIGATQTFTCGDTVTESCVFNCDLSCPTGHGLVIGSDDITIDGAGYTIDGVSPATCENADRAGISGTPLNEPRDNVTIKNLEIKNFCCGIHLEGFGALGKLTDVAIDNCAIHDNGVNITARKTHGIKAIQVHDSTIENCKIYNNTGGTGCTPPCENGGSGIFLKIGDDNVITNNEIYDNKKGGFFCKASPKRCEFSHNEVWGNHQGGILLRCKCTQNFTIEYNNASCNYGTGIFIGGPCNTIRHNTVCNNMNGAIEGLPDTGTNGCGVNFGRDDVGDCGYAPCGSMGSRLNSLINNTICDNEYLDIWERAAVRGTNNGVENKCDEPDGWNDDGVTGCTYPCEEEVWADLSITEKSEEWVVEGSTYNVIYTVKNIGDAEAGASTTSIKIDGTEEATDSVPVLAPDTSHTATLGPFTMSGDSDTILVCADKDNAVSESDETNNCVENVLVYPGITTVKIGSYTLFLLDGGEVIVPVEILNASDIAGGSAKVVFNPSVVNVERVVSGHFGMPEANIDNTSGFVHIAVSRATAVGIDEAVLANVLFKGISEGTTDLNIENASLNFEDATVTTPGTANGSITVETRMLGDLNHNEMIDTGDATLALRMVVGLEPTNMLGDMNQNGMIDTGDATLILRTVVGLPI